jgi:plastocyanin
MGRRNLLRGLLAGGALVAAAPLIAACGGAQATGGGPAISKPASGQVAKPPAAAGATAGATVEMNDQNKFVPESITVKKGTAVTWKNVGAMIHNVQTDPAGVIDKANAQVPSGATPFASPMIEAGKTWSYTFDVVGEYRYFCLPHQALGMVGKVTVTE